MLKKFLADLETANPRHFIWITIVVSELLAAVFNAAQSYLWWGRISRDLLLIGALDALFVPLLVAPAVIYFVRNTSRLEKMNEQLKREIEDRTQAQAAMALSKERYRAMIDAYDGLVYICSPDYRIESKQRGSGLGLATSYSIVKKQQGAITVESEPGEVSTFRIYLPASENKVTRQQAGKSSELPKGQGRILVMDDDECIRETTRNILLVLGYEVELTSDGADAIAAYREARECGRPFDVVIMDLTVPGGMGGKETIGKLIEIDPAVKAIVASGYSNDLVLAEYGNYGFKGAVAKPYRLRDLGETVLRVVQSA